MCHYACQTPAANFLIVLNPRCSYSCTAEVFTAVTVSDSHSYLRRSSAWIEASINERPMRWPW